MGTGIRMTSKPEYVKCEGCDKMIDESLKTLQIEGECGICQGYFDEDCDDGDYDEDEVGLWE